MQPVIWSMAVDGADNASFVNVESIGVPLINFDLCC
jgi:hypothetical protein